MANYLKEKIGEFLAETLDQSIKNGTSELQKKFDKNIHTASTELSANIDRISDRFDGTVSKAEESLKSTVQTASSELEKNIRILSSEIHNHRSIAKEHVTQFVDDAIAKFEAMIERRVVEIKSQASTLIDDKLASLRKSLSEAAAEQKKVFLRNASVAVGSAIIVALVSITAKKLSNSPFDALTVFRIVLGMFAAGGAASLLYRLFLRYKTKSELEKDAIKVIISDVRMLNPKGFVFQAAVLLVALTTWLILTFKPELLGF